jgi:hypothetical protein
LEIFEGMLERDENGKRCFWVLPYILGLDKKWRTIPREVMGDFCGRPRTGRDPVGPDGPTKPVPGYDRPEDIPPDEDEN